MSAGRSYEATLRPNDTHRVKATDRSQSAVASATEPCVSARSSRYWAPLLALLECLRGCLNTGVGGLGRVLRRRRCRPDTAGQLRVQQGCNFTGHVDVVGVGESGGPGGGSWTLIGGGLPCYSSRERMNAHLVT